MRHPHHQKTRVISTKLSYHLDIKRQEDARRLKNKQTPKYFYTLNGQCKVFIPLSRLKELYPHFNDRELFEAILQGSIEINKTPVYMDFS